MGDAMLRQVDASRRTEAGEVVACYQLDAKIRFAIAWRLLIMAPPSGTPATFEKARASIDFVRLNRSNPHGTRAPAQSTMHNSSRKPHENLRIPA